MHDGQGAHHPVWRLSLLDASYDGEWHWRLDQPTTMKIVEFLTQMERLTWQEVWDQRFHSKNSDGPKHKFIPTDHLCPAARKRLEDLHLDDVETVFRFRLGNLERLWGVLSEETPKVFYPIWWDPAHKICPSKDK